MCSVLDFKLSKSQKKKLKRFNKFLIAGKSIPSKPGDVCESSLDLDSGDDMNVDLGLNDIPNLNERAEKAQKNIQSTVINSIDTAYNKTSTDDEPNKTSLEVVEQPLSLVGELSDEEKQIEESNLRSPIKKLKTGVGMDPNKPLCKKAKLLRQERREKKLAQLNISMDSVQMKKTVTPVKSLEDFLNDEIPDLPAHRLKITLVRSSPASEVLKSTFKASFEVFQRYQISIHNDPVGKWTETSFTKFLVNSPLKIKLVNVESHEMNETLNTSWEVFTKYQMVVHKEDRDECSMSTYTEFLVKSPLKPWNPKDGPPQGYGSFHQQYWLDDRLIAVGVMDILPYCVSSVYFFYDPDFHFLVLGTYGSLREIALCRSLHLSVPSLQYYYMGFYIHTCPKMRYKGAYSPSFLLCPEVYSWHPIEYCISLLEKKKYCRFNKDPEAQDANNAIEVGDVSVLFKNKVISFNNYCSLKKSSSLKKFVTEYAQLVGNKLSKRLYLLLQ